ncbi:MAG: ATP-binding protein, partial [Chitinophagaceae bacterium]
TLDIIWELNFETNEYLVHDGKEKLLEANTIHDWRLGIDSQDIAEEDRERVRKNFHDARMNSTVQIWKEEYHIRPDHKESLYMLNHALFIRDKEGKAIRVIGAIADITQRKKLEKELLERQRTEQVRLTSVAIEAQERERTYIGQELHDNVNQILVGTILALSSIRETQEKASEIIKSSIGNIKDAIGENRKIAHELVAPDLTSESLIRQLDNLARFMFQGIGISITINYSHYNAELLNDGQKLAIYRVAQEQCTNIVKYANATEVIFTLKTGDDSFSMLIADNGIGVDVDRNKSTTGIGLQNIAGRVGVFNGNVTIHSSPGKGFELEIAMPLV